MTRPTRLATALGIVTLLVTACQAASTPAESASPAASTSATATVASSATAVPGDDATPGATPAATTEPIPSADLDTFSCDLPVVEPSAAGVTNIVDVRVGTHDGFDRIVFEFTNGTPEFTLDRPQPPFAAPGSGFPVEVEGNSVLGLVMRGGSRQTDAGGSSYDGPTNFDPAFAQLVDLVEGGDFERQAEWYLGLNAEACVRVIQLADPDRLVIDVEH